MSIKNSEKMLAFALKVMKESERRRRHTKCRSSSSVDVLRSKQIKQEVTADYRKKNQGKRQKRLIGYISPGGMIKTEKGWRKAKKAELGR